MKTLIKNVIFISFPVLLLIVCTELHAQNQNVRDIGNEFLPANYMGCVNNINIDPAWNENPHSTPDCFKITYLNTCSLRWAGIYWVNATDTDGSNFGSMPGTDLSATKYTEITFWARGDTSTVVEFGAFGINPKGPSTQFPYKDDCPKVTIPGRTTHLTENWKQYIITIPCDSLKSVIGGFYWTASWNANPAGLTFYLDDIFYHSR